MAAQLLSSIDRLILKVSPVALGRGLSLFATPDSVTAHFEPTAREHFTNGVEIVEYVPRKD